MFVDRSTIDFGYATDGVSETVIVTNGASADVSVQLVRTGYMLFASHPGQHMHEGQCHHRNAHAPIPHRVRSYGIHYMYFPLCSSISSMLKCTIRLCRGKKRLTTCRGRQQILSGHRCTSSGTRRAQQTGTKQTRVGTQMWNLESQTFQWGKALRFVWRFLASRQTTTSIMRSRLSFRRPTNQRSGGEHDSTSEDPVDVTWPLRDKAFLNVNDTPT